MNQGINTAQLPEPLQAALTAAGAGRVDYPEREAQLLRIRGYLQNGDFFTAESQLKNLIQRQDNLRSGMSSGLQSQLHAAEAGAEDFPECDAQLLRIRTYLQNGDFLTAESLLNSLTQRLENLRSGLPAALRAGLQEAEADGVNYPERGAQLERIRAYLQDGDFFTAERQIKNLTQRQDNLRSGLTTRLKALLITAEARSVKFPERDAQLLRIRSYLQNGDFFTAESQLENLIKRQDNLRSGLPEELKALLTAADAGSVKYPEREAQLLRIRDYLDNGDFFMAESQLKNLTQRQDNLRGTVP